MDQIPRDGARPRHVRPEPGPVIRARPVDPAVGGTLCSITPGTGSWTYTGLEVVVLPDGGSHHLALPGCEALVLPLAGGGVVSVDDAAGTTRRIELAGRRGPFTGPTDAAYVPVGATATLTAVGPLRVAVCSARASHVYPARRLDVTTTTTELRGAGSCSRAVTNYTLGTDFPVDHLLVCEVFTPGGNTSSYPPHKHDEHADDERELEEIYYFEVADGPAGPGVAFHRNYGTAARPLDVLAEVRTGDIALVPHGYHGPEVALPGHDLYYLNVMAGPAEDRRWLMVDDPAYHWLRERWRSEPVDTRLNAHLTDHAATNEAHT